MQDNMDKKTTLNYDLFAKAVQFDGMALEYVPNEMKTEHLCKLALEQNIGSFKYMPQDLMTECMCIQFIKFNDECACRELFNWKCHCDDFTCIIPDRLKTQRICKKIVKKRPLHLKFFDKYIFDEELYKNAVKKNPRCIMYIPKKLRTKNICQPVIDHQYFYDSKLWSYIPKDVMSESNYIDLLNNHPDFNLDNVPKDKRTIEICKIGICSNTKWINEIEVIPKNILINKEIFTLVMMRDKTILKYVPDDLKTEELCLLAINNHGDSIKYIPSKMITEKMCEDAIKQSFCLQYIPQHMKEYAIECAIKYQPRKYLKSIMQ